MSLGHAIGELIHMNWFSFFCFLQMTKLNAQKLL